MKKLMRVGLTAAAIALMATMARPAAYTARADGGILIEPTFGSGPDTLNPLFCNDNTCNKIIDLAFPDLIGVNAESQYFEKGAAHGLVTDWSASADGLVYTFTLRQDMKWSDGQPITADDMVFSYNVITNPDAQSPLVSGVTNIEKVEAPDKYTLVITYKVADCTALSTANSIPVAPKHVLGEVPAAELQAHPYSTAPTVSAGRFKFESFRASEQTTLVPNPDYVDLEEKQVLPGGFIQPVVPDQTVLVQQYLAGEVNMIDAPAVSRRAELRADASAGNSQIFDFPGNSWDYIALNQADPTDPQPGLDADGKLVEQKPHPLFGDVRVRRALAMALDVDAIIKGAVFGEGTRMASFIIPSSWAVHKGLTPMAYDPVAAGRLLDEAGFPVGPDGLRVAKGAKHAPDGTMFKFTLLTNQGNTRREAIGTIAKDQLSQLGIEVDFQAIDFNVLNDTVRSQQYDARIGGWLNSFPDDPDATSLFLPEADIPGSGNNFTSYSNPKLTETMQKALTVPGCGFAERTELYKQAQEIMAEDMPYIWLYVINGWYGARSEVNDFTPAANIFYNRIERWKLEAQ
jgi:peptide/nickel transport system substrate-binding protein